jgi:glucose/arabinose dehydrogenase
VRISIALGLIALAGAQLGAGQQTVTFQGGIPLAPSGLEKRALPDTPVEYDTAEGQRIRVVAIRGLSFPTSIAWLPDGTMLVAERTGRLRIIRNGVVDPQPATGVPASVFAGESGLPGAVHGIMDVVVHPQFAQNRYIYLYYTKPIDEKRRTIAVARGRWDGAARGGAGLTEVKDIITLDAASTGRMAFDRNNLLYINTGGGDPQTALSLGGKTLRYTDEGGIPMSNPFARGQGGARPEVFTLGHRNVLGMAMHPGTGEMWANENGPNGGDEINILKPGANYGWPIVSYGRQYPGPWQADRSGHPIFEPPVVYWMPSIAVSGMMFYTGDRFPKWKGDVFVGALREGEIPGTGHIQRILFNEKMEELRRESLLRPLRQRIRDVRQGPDGLIYLATDEKEGAILRIEPAS